MNGQKELSLREQVTGATTGVPLSEGLFTRLQIL